MDEVYGVVLAGGLARRMGGGDKVMRLVDGRSMLERVTARLGPQCTGLLLNANGDPRRFAFAGLPVAADTVPGRAGPLAGVLAALDWLADRRPDVGWAVTVAGDAPFPPLDLVARLGAARRNAGAEGAVATSGGRTHWTVGLWPVAMRPALRAFLMDDSLRKVETFVDGRFVARADWPVDPVDPFFNVNTPDDVANAERLARLLDGAPS